jgi:CheY-like chemotaxis protein
MIHNIELVIKPTTYKGIECMKHILIVDDDKHIAAILNELLSVDGYEVDVANDANEALEFLNQLPLDLIITDILMPKMDGIEFIKSVRQQSGVPIIAMSGGRRASTPANTIINKSSADLKLSNAITVGANAILTKPFVRAQLQQAVKSALNT